ncbi:NADPH:quinone reductase-like Zn-dependent oxidoreductase [Allocatelliglobosispora scoriae]|uniref:NADPH:quinone reductase-like Zn-dependent oxidoreductase n=1 Tax=Allocatelliglobosispora scoriae TaxID=643052 RepID=A0A841BVV0_9ACTN|nr:zinc-binding dehydrogenase [Allocatelliglobosispora scoriae]MBB5871805.1 NADPH:quinone reductase-like Zn-dependent oxidoreductase [Allocatelliglobosispora scoriae]
MRAIFAESINPENPLAGLVVGERPDPVEPEGWTTVRVTSSSLNHHDLWSLRGVGLPTDRLPMILGCDAVGIAEDGSRVLVHSVVPDPADPRGYSLLSERHQGTLADRLAIPAGNLVVLPESISDADAAVLPTAWLTAYSMLARGRVKHSDAVLVQGAGGGVATAAVILAHALGKRVYATSRDEAKRERIAALGATALAPGAKLPERVGVVIETVGAATFEHSMKCAAPGGRIVVSGATSGHLASVDLRRIFALQLEILGSSMGTQLELDELVQLVADRGVQPVIDSTFDFADARSAFERLATGDIFGKIVIRH